MVKLNNAKFIAVLNQLGMIVPENADVSVVDNITEGHVIASVRGHRFKVRGDTWERFVARIETTSHMEIYEMLQSRFSGLEYIPALDDDEEQSLPVVAEDATELPFEYREMIHQRLSSIVGVVGSRISNIATALNTRIDIVSKDVNFIKDYDGMFSFDIPTEGKFTLVMCFDKIPPINETKTSIEITRTPMDPEFQTLFFGESLEVVKKEIREIEHLVNAFLDSKLVNSTELSKKYTLGLFEGAVTNCIMNVTPIVVMFGGIDNWRLFGDSTPNTIACRKYLEPEVERVIDTLKAIPLKDNVVIYSLDLNKLGVYGRDENNKVVTSLLTDVSNELTSRWSDGFLELMRLRLAQNDNQHLFYY